MNPAAENRRHASRLRKERGDIAQQWLLLPAIGGADGGLDQGSLGLIESAANGRAEVDRIRGRRPQPRLVASIAGAKAEDVQRVARARVVSPGLSLITTPPPPSARPPYAPTACTPPST